MEHPRPGTETDRPGWYLPHRAIILLGVLLTAVALVGATLGIVNTGRAEDSITQLSDRYLVLQPPVRDLRASISAFQVDAAQAFAGSTSDPSLLTAALTNSGITDRNYATLEHLLASEGLSGLAPGLNSQMTEYVSARSKLGAFLAGEAISPGTAQIAADEQAADVRLDTTLAGLQASVSDRLAATAKQALAAARAAHTALAWSIALGILIAVAITWMLAGKAVQVEREAARSEATLGSVTRRTEFEARLQRGFEMAKSDVRVFGLVAEALGVAAPHQHSELLLAESATAHFQQVLVGAGSTPEGGCGVVSPDDCPAASRGLTMSFPLSTAIDACPNLRGRGCSALCVPVSIGGSSVGVFHVTDTEGSAPSEGIRSDVEVVARLAAERLAMLRAFELSQTQANSDSLTGLMTRRSLERGVHDLHDEGRPYAVAYGDLDHFKVLNDTFGHDAGDRALRSFAEVLRDSLRPADIACRYGGEEFVIVLPRCPLGVAVAVLERVRTTMAKRQADIGLPPFTVSFGVATSEQADEFGAVVRLADQALLSAKGGGRDQIVLADGSAGPTAHDGDGTRPPPSWDPAGVEAFDAGALVATDYGIGNFNA